MFWRKLSKDLGVGQSLCGPPAAQQREELELAQSELQTAAVGQQPLPMHHCPPGECVCVCVCVCVRARQGFITGSGREGVTVSLLSLQSRLHVAGSQSLQHEVELGKLVQV